jgi:hypothetical protein
MKKLMLVSIIYFATITYGYSQHKIDYRILCSVVNEYFENLSFINEKNYNTEDEFIIVSLNKLGNDTIILELKRITLDIHLSSAEFSHISKNGNKYFLFKLNDVLLTDIFISEEEIRRLSESEKNEIIAKLINTSKNMISFTPFMAFLTYNMEYGFFTCKEYFLHSIPFKYQAIENRNWDFILIDPKQE